MNESNIETKPLPSPTAIKSVSMYTASPVECCDRCGQGIKYVAVVTLKDGTFFRYGMDCINKILAGDTSLKGLFAKNAKLLKKFEHWLEVLSRPIDQIPKGSEYYNSGIFMIQDDEGKGLTYCSNGGSFGSSLFHPICDEEKNAGAANYRAEGQTIHVDGKWQPYTPELRRSIALRKIEVAKAYYATEIARLSGFLARIVAKGLAVPVK